MPTEVAIQDEKAAKFLERAMKHAKTIKDGGRAYGMVLSSVVFQDITEHFEKEEGPDGAWTPWSEVYAQHMERIGRGNNKLLQFNGHLRQAFLPTNYRKVGEGILWYNPAKTSKGFPYAYAHDEGGPKLPERSFMWLSIEGSEKIAEVTLNYLLSKD